MPQTSYFSIGLQFYQRKEYPKAFECFQKVVNYNLGTDKELAESHYYLGLIHKKGSLGSKNYVSAKKHLLQSAKLKHGPAYFELGILYSKGNDIIAKNTRKAIDYYKKGIELGDNGCMLNLGVIYDEGNGVRQDQSKSFKLFEEAANHGDLDGMFNLAIMYEHGEHVEKDISKAMKYYCDAGSYPRDDRISELSLIPQSEVNNCKYKCLTNEQKNQNYNDLKNFCVEQLLSMYN